MENIDFPMVIDSTMRSAFVQCPQQFYQEFILKRAPKGHSIDLIAGGAYAKGLELVRTLVWGPEKASVDEALAAVLPYVVAEYGDIEAPEEKKHKSWLRVMEGLVAYFDRFPPATDHVQPVIKRNGLPAVEFRFSFPMQLRHPTTGDPILYAGRFDMLGEYNNTLWVVDDKTASQLGNGWDKSWRLRGQLTGYTFAAQQYGYNVQGAIVRGISFLKTGAYGFSEPIEYRAPFQIERWWVQLHRDVQRMINCWNEKDDEHPYGYWDYNLGETCSQWGGCPFMTLCSVANPEKWVEGDFQRREWNPLDANPAGRPTVQSTPTTFRS